MKRAVIIGASSGIGFELAKILDSNGYELGLAEFLDNRAAKYFKEWNFIFKSFLDRIRLSYRHTHNLTGKDSGYEASESF